MQFTRLASLFVFLFSLGFLATASPVAARSDVAVRAATGTNDAQALAIGAALEVKVQADIAVILEILAEVDLSVDLFAAVFVQLQADIEVAVVALAALQAAKCGAQAQAIAEVYANIFLALFPVLEKCQAVPGLSAAYFSLVDVKIEGLLAGLNVVVVGVVAIIGTLTASLNVLLSVNLDVFANILGILGIGIVISL